MSEGLRLFLIILVAVIFSGAAIALLLFAAIFPLINHFFHTNLPILKFPGSDFDETEDEPENDRPEKAAVKAGRSKEKPPAKTDRGKDKAPVKADKGKERSPAKTEKTKDKKPDKPDLKKFQPVLSGTRTMRPQLNTEVRRTTHDPKGSAEPKIQTEPRARTEQKSPTERAEHKSPTERAEHKSPTEIKPRVPDLHKDVPTIRVDTLFKGAADEKPLTVSKIDAEGKLAGVVKKEAPQAVKKEIPQAAKKQDAAEAKTVQIAVAPAPARPSRPSEKITEESKKAGKK